MRSLVSLVLFLFATEAFAEVIWVYGDGNANRTFPELVQIADPGWTLVDKTRPSTGGGQFPTFAVADLANDPVDPDVVVNGYAGGLVGLFFCLFPPHNVAIGFLDQAVQGILDGMDLFEDIGATVILTRGPGVAWKLAAEGSEKRAQGLCIEASYEYVWDQIKTEAPIANWRIPRDDPALWDTDLVHVDPPGAAKIAERIRDEVRRHD